MKYWRGFLVAAIFAVISGALLAFAKAHSALVDMIYPYVSKSLVSTFADWSSNVSFCLWSVIVLALVVVLLVSIILMFILRWNSIQWLGWVMAGIMFMSMFSTVLFGLNKHAGPLAEDIGLEITEYTVTELNEAAIYFRDLANPLADSVQRDKKGRPDFGEFEAMATQAGAGFEVLTYQEAMSVFSGSTAPVKSKQLGGGALSKTYPLTGECVVDPSSPDLVLPFIMCSEMARRMSIYNEEDAKYAAFLACKFNQDENFQYSGYCMAFYFCYTALKQDPTSVAQACIGELEAGIGENLKKDLEICQDVFGRISVRGEGANDAADLVTCWYIQKFITPLIVEEEKPFDPLDPNQVDIEYVEPDPTPLPAS